MYYTVSFRFGKFRFDLFRFGKFRFVSVNFVWFRFGIFRFAFRLAFYRYQLVHFVFVDSLCEELEILLLRIEDLQ